MITQCECCSSPLGKRLKAGNVDHIICNQCLGFMSRWFFEFYNNKTIPIPIMSNEQPDGPPVGGPGAYLTRDISEHKVNPANDRLKITVMDPPGSGGASHVYKVEIEPKTNDSQLVELAEIKFQNGPINDAGVNGVTQEALLAIVADRLRSFQAGPFSTRDNSIALTHVEDALLRLQRRTLERMRRGVEGTLKK